MRNLWNCLTALAMLAMAAGPAQASDTVVVGDLPVQAEGELEATEGLQTQYGMVTTSEGLRLRSYITRPANASTPLPAVFVTQWVSCGTMAFRPDRESQLRLLAQRSGLVMIRIDRAGSGDSEGPGCDQLDYDTEVRHYREALAELKAHPWVDPAQIVILGSSLGSTTAPLVAAGNDIAGVIVQGGGAVTYLERMINFERLYLERSGNVPPERIHDEMIQRIAFLQRYLIGQQTPAAIAAAHPELAGLWERIRGTEPNSHYGRPFAWHWQAARANFLKSWLSLEVPVMVIFGEYEQFENRHGHRLIVDMINRQTPGRASWLEISNADHGLQIYPDAFAAYAYDKGVAAPQLYVTPVSNWLRQVVRTGR